MGKGDLALLGAALRGAMLQVPVGLLGSHTGQQLLRGRNVDATEG
jgi:hypothetical protein